MKLIRNLNRLKLANLIKQRRGNSSLKELSVIAGIQFNILFSAIRQLPLSIDAVYTLAEWLEIPIDGLFINDYDTEESHVSKVDRAIILSPITEHILIVLSDRRMLSRDILDSLNSDRPYGDLSYSTLYTCLQRGYDKQIVDRCRATVPYPPNRKEYFYWATSFGNRLLALQNNYRDYLYSLANEYNRNEQ